MKLLCRNYSSLLPFARNYFYCPSVCVHKRWESGSREISTDEVSRRASASSFRGKFNLVGPRHHSSNIRKIVFARLNNETTKVSSIWLLVFFLTYKYNKPHGILGERSWIFKNETSRAFMKHLWVYQLISPPVAIEIESDVLCGKSEKSSKC